MTFQRILPNAEDKTAVKELCTCYHIISAGLSSWGALCQTQMGGPCPLSLRSPYPCRIHNSLSFKVGFGTAKIDLKSAILLQCIQFDPKFKVEGDVARQSFSQG